MTSDPLQPEHSDTPTMTRITPIIPVVDPVAAGAWFERCLGFEASPAGTGMHLSRDAVNIRLVLKADDMDMSDPRRQQSVYINVSDVDAHFAACKDALEASGTQVRPPFDRGYGAREFHVIYESLLIFFGQPIGATS
ncbi:hypothetical protein JANAI62_21760 [Jannaschia pagri]|uniref:VOC domain-containing protein n=1 Tax=Jannaschia pagri TaxID=2829797 RepID=A0ABQ4NME2_9RHOB|nr:MULTISPECIES: hypothetical protein [unclassified Jannaschia]GIT91719.1 hypothetical protein JANAI61_21770 [Jannaschia sp. AI_61]GIT95553.1 hypothetical protein JANAI62_21760 [Jannaschia sp. AI_62]